MDPPPAPSQSLAALRSDRFNHQLQSTNEAVAALSRRMSQMYDLELEIADGSQEGNHPKHEGSRRARRGHEGSHRFKAATQRVESEMAAARSMSAVNKKGVTEVPREKIA